MPENVGTRDIAHEKNTKAPEGAAAGGGAALVLGGTLGWLAGIGALAIPGLGPFIAAGPIMATLAVVGVSTAAGDVAGGLIGMGIPEYEAKRYEGRIRNGGILLSVHSDNSQWTKKAKSILESPPGGSHRPASREQISPRATDRFRVRGPGANPLPVERPLRRSGCSLRNCMSTQAFWGIKGKSQAAGATSRSETALN